MPLTANEKMQCCRAKLKSNEEKYGGIRGLMVKVLDSKFEGCEFKTHNFVYPTLPESTQLQTLFGRYLRWTSVQKPGLSTGHISLHGFLRHNAWGGMKRNMKW